MQTLASTARQFAENHASALVSVFVAGASIVGLRLWLSGGMCRSKVRLDGKTVLITGANSGIGKETALDMARRGARVILACRDVTRARLAAEEIQQQSGNGNVVVKKLDLASLQSVRDLAKDVEESEERLDVLINNAGILMYQRWKTEDGFEMQFGVNHLGHFLLTNCLLNLLKKSTPSRIVIVSSRAHAAGQLDLDNINDYSPWMRYCQSKLANVLFCKELAARLQGTGVTVYSVHPGVICTEIIRHTPLWLKVIIVPFMWMSKSPREGAQTTIYCAIEESIAEDSGLYYSDCAPKMPAPQAMDDAAAQKLWEVSASMVGLA